MRLPWTTSSPRSRWIFSAFAAVALAGVLLLSLFYPGRTPAAQPGVIELTAGNGSPGFQGDGASAVLAKIYFPYGVVSDSVGRIFIADQNNHKVRRVNTNGTIETIAGTGAAATSGDGGPAVQAALDLPRGLAFDAAGNLLIADYGANRIRSISPGGVITTVAGTGTLGSTGDGGLATVATLARPSGVAALPSGGFLIADTDNNKIRIVGANGVIDTYAGTGNAGFGGDNGLATAALFNKPVAVAVSPAGEVWVADSQNHRIRRIRTLAVTATPTATAAPPNATATATPTVAITP